MIKKKNPMNSIAYMIMIITHSKQCWVVLTQHIG